MDPDKLGRLDRYEVHLDRKLERMRAKLLRLKNLRQGTAAPIRLAKPPFAGFAGALPCGDTGRGKAPPKLNLARPGRSFRAECVSGGENPHISGAYLVSRDCGDLPCGVRGADAVLDF